jgi:hypothetical protein
VSRTVSRNRLSFDFGLLRDHRFSASNASDPLRRPTCTHVGGKDEYLDVARASRGLPRRCGYAGLSKREAIRVAAEGAKHQAHGRLAVRHALKRKTPDGHMVWLVEFSISPRRVSPWLGGRICVLSFNNSSATTCRTPPTSSATQSRQPRRRASGQSPARAPTSNRTYASSNSGAAIWQRRIAERVADMLH